MLYSIHTAIAAVAKAPEFEIDKEDAQKLGGAIAEVLKYHHVTMTPQQEAYATLIDAAANVYPPMFISLYVRKQMEAKERAQRRGPVAVPPAPSPTPRAANGSANVPHAFDPTKIEIPKGD